MTSLKSIALGLATCLVAISCKLPGGVGASGGFDPLAGTLGEAATDMPFLELTGSAAPSEQALTPVDAPYRLRAGDVLELEVVGEGATMTRSVVLPDGMLYFDAAEGVKAAGRTRGDVEMALAKQLSTTYSFPVVSANLFDVQGNRYTVLGQVKTPGSYPLQQPVTLIDAIASAGGLAASNSSGKTQDLADLGRSVLIRDGKMMSVNFRKLIEEGDMMHNVYMKPGDYVFLPANGSEKIYVLGAVNRATALPYSSHVTFISAVAAARGVQKDAFVSGLVLIRGSFHEPKLAGVNLRAIMTGKSRNFPLQPGDIIWVPKKPWHKLSEYAELALTSVATSVALNQSYDIFGENNEQDQRTIDAGANNVEVDPQPTAEPAPEPESAAVPAPEPAFEEPVVVDPAPAL